MIKEFSGRFRFLSNFYVLSTEILYEGLAYASVEHAYQAAKTLDKAQRRAISRMRTPGEAKKAGKNISLRPDWEQVKQNVMLDLLRLKFAQPALAKQLADTVGHKLVEGNYWHDNIWGICTCKACGNDGQNYLGQTLMQVRDEICS